MAEFVPFTAQTRMSGLDLDGVPIRKGAAETIVGWCGRGLSQELAAEVERISRAGGDAARGCPGPGPCGVVELKDVVKEGLVERFAQLRKMAECSVMPGAAGQGARRAQYAIERL